MGSCTRLESIKKDVEKFDRRIKRAGFTSRSDFFSALVRIVISEPKRDPKDVASAWILNHMPPLSEEKIEQAIEDAIRKHLFAVVAIHGAELSFERTWMASHVSLSRVHGLSRLHRLSLFAGMRALEVFCARLPHTKNSYTAPANINK